MMLLDIPAFQESEEVAALTQEEDLDTMVVVISNKIMGLMIVDLEEGQVIIVNGI